MQKGIDYTGVSVMCFCHDGNGRYVLLKRGENARDEHGRWDLVGGAIEFGKTIEETIQEELSEEIGVTPLETQELGFLEIHRTYNNQPTHWITLYYKVLVDPYQVRNGEPHKFDEIGWFRLDAMPEPLHSYFPQALKRFGDQLAKQ